MSILHHPSCLLLPSCDQSWPLRTEEMSAGGLRTLTRFKCPAQPPLDLPPSRFWAQDPHFSSTWGCQSLPQQLRRCLRPHHGPARPGHGLSWIDALAWPQTCLITMNMSGAWSFPWLSPLEVCPTHHSWGWWDGSWLGVADTLMDVLPSRGTWPSWTKGQR